MKSDKTKEIKDVIGQVLNSQYEQIEDNLNPSMTEGNLCPYNTCDGSGYYTVEKGLSRIAVKCECYDEEVLRRKLKNSNMSKDIWNKQWVKTDVTGVLLHPVVNPPAKKVRMGKNNRPLAVQEPETAPENMERCYKQIQLKIPMKNFVQEYTKIALTNLNQPTVDDVTNLLFLGDVGRGKTFMANEIGKEFLKNDKKVYFTTMRSLVKDLMNPEKEIEKIVATVDLLLIDELGYEYHTNTGYAVTQIKELLRVRYNKKMPVVCTTNLYPSEIEELYDKSLMSLFKGTYLMMFMDSQNGDYRLEEAETKLSNLHDIFEI